MDAPLSLYLTHFRREQPAVLAMPDLLEIEPPEAFEAFEETTSLEPLDLEGDDQQDEPVIDHEATMLAAVQDALSKAEADHAEMIAGLQLSHEAALAETVDAARAAWIVSESTATAALIETAFATLKNDLSAGIASVLRPMLAEAVLERTLQSVGEALDHLLADPDHPTIVLRGPGDLLAAIGEARLASGGGSIGRIDYVEADTVEVAIEAAGTHVETRLAAALAAIQETGA